jgi:DNA-binding beta-propeller fold protein YncE
MENDMTHSAKRGGRVRTMNISVALTALLASVGTGGAFMGISVAQTQAVPANVAAPKFEVDTMWPKPLPNHWILGSVIGVSVDADDHVWVIHRGTQTVDENEKRLDSKTANCCAVAPPILEFDQAGNLLRHWGGPGEGYEWPTGAHAITIDYKGNVWLGGNGKDDSQILKFTRDGKFLLQVGKKGARYKPGAPVAEGQYGATADYAPNSNDPVSFGKVAQIFVDPKANEAFVADGYLNKRVAVLDADTGKLKRYWGAYGKKVDDTKLPDYDPSALPSDRFRNPVHCAVLAVDRLLYVCDRRNNRIQVFTPEGKFVKEAFYDTNTKGSGAIWDITMSRDPQQQYLYVADGTNNQIKVIDRQSLKLLTTFGDGGRQPGQFYGVHSMATDSKGNLYTTETWEGKRVQRFNFKGVEKVPPVQGVVWPKRP